MSAEAEIISMLFVILASVFLLVIAYSLFTETKRIRRKKVVEDSQNMRKHVTNLIVLGKLRQLAEKEKVDIDLENEYFLDYMDTLFSEDRCKRKDIDDRIEENINEEIEVKNSK